jgi:hypothetical protein
MKELAAVKDHMTSIKERITEVCHGEHLARCCEAARRIVIGRRACV